MDDDVLQIRLFDLEEMLNEIRRFIELSDGFRLRDCWKDDKKSQWDEYMLAKHKAMTAILDFGFCFKCGEICDGDCE